MILKDLLLLSHDRFQLCFLFLPLISTQLHFPFLLLFHKGNHSETERNHQLTHSPHPTSLLTAPSSLYLRQTRKSSEEQISLDPSYSEQQRADRHHEVSEIRCRQPRCWMQIVSRASRVQLLEFVLCLWTEVPVSVWAPFISVTFSGVCTQTP